MFKQILVATAISLPIVLAGCSHPAPVAYYPPPPSALPEIARQGFHDGFEAARRDMAESRPPDVNRHPRFRKPPVPPPAFEDYRHGFRDGYRNAYEHGAAPPPPGY